MANSKHVDVLSKGVRFWNEWRESESRSKPDLVGLDLSERDLSKIDFSEANIRGAVFKNSTLVGVNFKNADATGANFGKAVLKTSDFTESTLIKASLRGSILDGARLDRVDARNCQLRRARLRRVSCQNANMAGANFADSKIIDSTFSGTSLKGVDLTRASLINVKLPNVDLSGSRVYGVSAWDLDTNDHTTMHDLIVSSTESPIVTVDDIRVAQLVNLMLSSATLRHVVDTMATRMALVLGRFSSERKDVLEAITLELRSRNYIPVIFDFPTAGSRTLTETVRCLAHLSRFVIADITDARSVPQELMAIVPHLPSVPVLPIIEENASEWAMFESFKPYPWVLPLNYYNDQAHLVNNIFNIVVSPLEDWLSTQESIG